MFCAIKTGNLFNQSAVMSKKLNFIDNVFINNFLINNERRLKYIQDHSES